MSVSSWSASSPKGIEPFETDDPRDRRLALGVTGILLDFNTAGVIEAADAHTADRIRVLAGEPDDEMVLTLALVVRSLRHGSVCLDLAGLPMSELPDGLVWPEGDWLGRVATSALARAGVLHVDAGAVYLDRYWREETQVRDDLLSRLALPPPAVDDARLVEAAGRLFPDTYADQRSASLAAARQWTTVVTGGPGTGKTTAVAGLLALLADQSPTPLRIALAAPTGKAAAQLQDAVRRALAVEPLVSQSVDLGQPSAQTLHRLLGWTRGSRNRFRHHRRNRLPHDVIVIDETSMVSLTHMARLLEAVRDDCRLVLLGDADQLASVEAGAVLADLVAGLSRRAPSSVAALVESHRFGPGIAALANALRVGDADEVIRLLRAGGEGIELLDPGEPATQATLRERLLDHAVDVRSAAERGDGREATRLLGRHRLLCAHRDGPWGVSHWNRVVERGLSQHTGLPIGGGWGQEWYVGRPLLLTTNDYGLELFNGDTGVVVVDGHGVRAAVVGPDQASGPRLLATSRLTDVETMHAMTVHKSQGSQATEITVLLPPEDSPLLTRELFYTAVTRAEKVVRVVGTEAAVRLAVERRAQRASGLAVRLSEGGAEGAAGPCPTDPQSNSR